MSRRRGIVQFENQNLNGSVNEEKINLADPDPEDFAMHADFDVHDVSLSDKYE